MMSTWKWDVHMAGEVINFVTCLKMGWGITRLVIFCDCHKCMTPKWFKITTNSITRGSSFFFNIMSQARCIMSARKPSPHPPPPPSSPSPNLFFSDSTDDQTKAHVTFSSHLIFYVKNILAY